MADYKKIFWISSYPRSGNTWLRLILCGLFFTKDGYLKNLDILKKIPKFDTLNNFQQFQNERPIFFIDGTEVEWQ